FHRHQVVVQAHRVAHLDVPLDDGGVGQAFAEVGEEEGVPVAHVDAGSVVGMDRGGGRADGSDGDAPARRIARAGRYEAASVRFAASTMRAVDGMYFISSRNSGMWVS